MTKETNKVVSVTYELTSTKNESELIEKTTTAKPLTFLLGKGFLLPRFEENIKDLKVGGQFDFILTAEEAYGGISDKAIINVPIAAFLVDGQVDKSILEVGRSIPMMDNEGNRLNGVVVEITDDFVKMDFNHPLAGEDLHFKGEVIEVRDASSEEMEHGHIHQSGGGCGEGCGSDCGSGCGSDSGSDSDCSGGCCH